MRKEDLSFDITFNPWARTQRRNFEGEKSGFSWEIPDFCKVPTQRQQFRRVFAAI